MSRSLEQNQRPNTSKKQYCTDESRKKERKTTTGHNQKNYNVQSQNNVQTKAEGAAKTTTGRKWRERRPQVAKSSTRWCSRYPTTATQRHSTPRKVKSNVSKQDTYQVQPEAAKNTKGLTRIHTTKPKFTRAEYSSRITPFERAMSTRIWPN